MRNKKVDKLIVIGAILIWAIIIFVLYVYPSITGKKSQNSGSAGSLVITAGESTSVADDESQIEDGQSLTDSGTVIIYDNNGLLAQGDFITLKGHVFLNEKLTKYLQSNGYPNVSTLTLVDDSLASNDNISSFVLNIDGTSDSVKVTQDKISDEFTFSIVKSGEADSASSQ